MQSRVFHEQRSTGILPCVAIDRHRRTKVVLINVGPSPLRTLQAPATLQTRRPDIPTPEPVQAHLTLFTTTTNMSLQSLKDALRRVPSYGSIPPKDDPIADEASSEGHDVPADGGLAAWLTVFGAFLALFCSFGQMNAFGTFQSWYTTHQLRDLHPSTIAWIGSVQLWVFFFSVSTQSDRPRANASAHGR